MLIHMLQAVYYPGDYMNYGTADDDYRYILVVFCLVLQALILIGIGLYGVRRPEDAVMRRLRWDTDDDVTPSENAIFRARAGGVILLICGAICVIFAILIAVFGQSAF
ncbi:MAG: hypothetical protein IJT27_00460 [Clostridia bacterium]|nr:hypothetical protein [Clostridia bacterium]